MASLGPWSREELVENYQSLRREQRNGYARWLFLIKELRAQYDVNILEAERIALSNRHRRRWVERQINSQQLCRKRALAHIRAHGTAALIERVGDTFNFKVR